MRRRIRLWAAVIAALASLWLSAPAAAERLTITDAWIRATPPGARTAAAYLTLVNAGPADRLLGGRTAAAERLEVHQSSRDGGMARMQRLDALELPAGETVKLEPGGSHLMLIDVAAPLTPGTVVTVSLDFASAGTLEVEVPVVDGRAESASSHHSR